MSIQSHFFIESGIFSQNGENQSFGPVTNNEFRLTSKFTLTGSKKAFAICKGVILLQPQAGAGNQDKVNLILRTFKQPFPGLNVKYFIYRGLQKSDFFTSDSAPKIIEKTATTSDFINKINEDFHAFHDSRKDAQNNPIPLPVFTAKYIGYDPQVPDSTLLSSFFFKESEFVAVGETFNEKDDFELPMIDMGKSLGNFAEGECGIDVVLNYGDYKHNFDNGEFTFNLEYARKTEAKIVLGGTDINKKLLREQSTQFIDIAAFYGLFVNEGKVKVSNATGNITSKSRNAIYIDLLSNFFNKNRVYLYIESNRNRSYNYYDNYKLSEINSNNLKFGIPNNLTEDNYGYLDWPVHVFEIKQQGNSTDFNDISIQLVSSSSYEEIALYVALGNGDLDRGFITRENLIDPLNTSEDVNFSKVINFKVPNIDVNGEKKNISSLIQIIYVGKELNFYATSNNTVWGDKKRHSLYNNLFSNLTVTPIFTNNQNLLIAPVNKLSLISYKGFSNYMNESVLHGFVVFQQGKKDVINTDLSIETLTKEKVLFIAKKIETLDAFSIHKTEIFAQGVFAKKMNINSNVTDYSNYFTSLYGSKDFNLKHYIINDSEANIKTLSLNFKEELDFDFYNLGVTKDELNILKGIIPANSSNIDFYLHDPLDNPHISTTTNTSYFRYSLGIIYENGDGILSVSMPQDPIFIYGISHKFLATKEYAEYEEKSIIGDIVIETNI
ncbi:MULTISPECIES: hypothetical protein [unclassified Flavobacterium]|uniref:hypothetical protein n=1 Tax=unclassified Flavobacterium TaxID=196869 RepID=UPI00131E69B1|nr:MULTISPECIES: hypothetical protein [unclassified Flavobacterium]